MCPCRKKHVLNFEKQFFVCEGLFALGILERCEYTNCSSERDRTSPTGPLELVVKEPPGRDRNWFNGPPEIAVEEKKFTKLRRFCLEIKLAG